MKTKICGKCKIEKDISNFYIQTTYLKKNGELKLYYQSYCKSCLIKINNKERTYNEFKKEDDIKYNKKCTFELKEHYIKQLLVSRSNLSYSELKHYPKLIELQKEVIQYKRLLKTLDSKIVKEKLLEKEKLLIYELSELNRNNEN